jgi:hypothetical protein
MIEFIFFKHECILENDFGHDRDKANEITVLCPFLARDHALGFTIPLPSPGNAVP